MSLPEELASRTLESVVEGRAPAWLEVGHAGELLDCGGFLDRYGLEPACAGSEAADHMPALVGILPLEQAELRIPELRTASGRHADLILFAGSRGDWVLLLDAEDRVRRLQVVQQQLNELRLRRRSA